MWTWRNCQISLPLAQLCKNAQHRFSHVPFGVSLLLSCEDNNHFPKGNVNFLIINDLMSETSKTPHLDAKGFHRIFSTFYSLWKAIFLRLTIQVIEWVLSNKQKNKQTKNPQDKWWEAASVWQMNSGKPRFLWAGVHRAILDGEFILSLPHNQTITPVWLSTYNCKRALGNIVERWKDAWLGHKYQCSKSVRTSACPSTYGRIYHPVRQKLYSVGPLPHEVSKGACLY